MKEKLITKKINHFIEGNLKITACSFLIYGDLGIFITWKSLTGREIFLLFLIINN